LFYKPFVPLEGANDAKTQTRILKLAEIEHLIREQRWHDARQKSAELINVGLEGLRYLQT
jgi:hypothetical protein